MPSPIVAFRNRGDGTFEDVTSRWGTDFPGVHHAIATADFDGDGDLDFAANGLGDAVYLYRNESTAPRVAVRLRGARPNGQGIGALVTLRAAGLPAQSQEVVSGGRYMAASDPLLVFATAGARGDMELDVRWRSGRHSLVRGVRPNRLYEIEETGDPKPRPPRAVDEAGSPLFRDVSDRLAHVHRGRESDDFGRQPLRHASPSRFGPGVAWLDLDGDDREDLVVGAGRGGRTGVWWNRPESGFVPADVPWGHAPSRGDQVALAGWSGPPGMSRAWMAIAVSGGDDEGASAVEVTEIGGPGSPTVLAPSGAHPGPVAWGDLDGDGVPELFVGGGAIPGRYPLATPSHVFRRRSDGSWSEDPAWGAAGRDAGLVRAARWSDLDGDGSPDLVLACEWGPIRIFRNRGGRLEPWNPVVIAASDGSEPPARTEHLDALTGWWSGLAAGDFDEDGRLDLVVGNWGLNSAYRASPDRPLTFAFAAFRGSPEIDLIETEWDPLRGKRVPSRRMDELAPALPWLPARFPSHRAYAEASLVDVLGDLADSVGSVSATRLESLVLLNRGDSFRGVRLPDEAQWSPAFGISVADADGDGHEDVFLAQNFFGLRPELGRQDAGRGLWLAGDGKGGFRALSSRASGIRVDGEGRGSAVADFDGDGRPDLAVAQHGAETKLFANVGARPGLRVRLEGPPGNRRGVGSVLRFHRDGRGGPAREIAAGSGYGSQDGGIQVLGTGRAAGELRVVWPGGIARSVAVEAGASEITARFPGGD
ncbi:MAG: VCBS repeat-containing protein [Verrucomicrobiales bacterium]|nr:VCBS repeat-containing protein [Verrucomicrobiales bacterium]